MMHLTCTINDKIKLAAANPQYNNLYGIDGGGFICKYIDI